MLSEKTWDAVPPRAQVPGGGDVVTEPSSRAPPRAIWVLLILFIALQVADVVTTNYALAVPGNWEANPLMELAQAHFGLSWWIPKIAAAGLAAAVVLHSGAHGRSPVPCPITC